MDNDHCWDTFTSNEARRAVGVEVEGTVADAGKRDLGCFVQWSGRTVACNKGRKR
ncbi:MAG: hypothetical protein NVS4B8_08630 [Herpetosiphon sp.]